MKDRPVALALRSKTLAGKAVLGRGSRCLVLEGSSPDTVYKLTVDQASYLYMTEAVYGKSKHRPRVLKDLGEVGRYRKGPPLYLVETERLGPIKSKDARNALAQAYRRLEEHHYWLGASPSFRFPSSKKEVPWVPNSLFRFFQQINGFLEDFGPVYDFRLDMSVRQNYMQRKNGDLVASDPVFDRRLSRGNCEVGLAG